jgi:hypothetical protein
VDFFGVVVVVDAAEVEDMVTDTGGRCSFLLLSLSLSSANGCLFVLALGSSCCGWSSESRVGASLARCLCLQCVGLTEREREASERKVFVVASALCFSYDAFSARKTRLCLV